MTRIKHTRDREIHYRLGGRVDFPRGVREIDVDDDVATWAVETYDDVEFDETETDEPEEGPKWEREWDSDSEPDDGEEENEP